MAQTIDTVLHTEYRPSQSFATVKEVPGYARILKEVLTPEECHRLIQIAEARGFVPASIYTDRSGKEYYSDTRKSYRCIIDSQKFVDTLFQRLQSILPQTWKAGETIVGLNERLRILRYYPGDYFAPHSDGSYASPCGDISKITILIYLNDGYEGGFTTFRTEGEHDEWVSIFPETGMTVAQDQQLLHWVPPLEFGCKYVIRTEVMYRPIQTQGEYKSVNIR
jgi:hypothetical protein